VTANVPYTDDPLVFDLSPSPCYNHK